MNCGWNEQVFEIIARSVQHKFIDVNITLLCAISINEIGKIMNRRLTKIADKGKMSLKLLS